MTREDIIRMAIEARLNMYVNDLTEKQYIEVLERFAALVASAESEACAKVCEEIYTGEEASCDWPTPEMCATAIRARGNNK